MSKMSRIDKSDNKVSILQSLNRLFSRRNPRRDNLRKVSKEERPREIGDSCPKDTELEIKDGRRDTRRSYHSGCTSLWDADKKQRRMGRILQATARGREAEAISERKRKTEERAVRIRRLYKNRDFRLFWRKMQSDENFWLNEIQKPAGIKDGINLDYYYGFCNGNLKAIAELRDFVMGYQFKINKDANPQKKKD